MLGRNKNKVPTPQDLEEMEKIIEEKKKQLLENKRKLAEEKAKKILNEETEQAAKEELEKNKNKFDLTFLHELGMPYELWGKSGALYFDTDRTCQFVDVKIKSDASFEIGEKVFDLAKGKPYILKMDKKTARPIYILKHDNIIPIDITDLDASIPTPEEASRLSNLKTLETLSTITGGKVKKSVLVILVAASMMAGFVICFFAKAFGVF